MDKERIIKQSRNLLIFIAFLWLVFLLSVVFPLNNLGIVPRNITGLRGIILSPFLHGSFSHLAANSVSFFILGLLLIYSEKGRAVAVLIAVTLLGGAGTWLIGRSGTIHIGASGIIYGMLGYLVASGIFRRELKSVLLSIFVFLLYGGMIFGVLPMDSFVSWESHLCGFLAGILTASGGAKKWRNNHE